ncbi:hypothetical protein [Serratia sp. FGI94]|uniref:hypothetical protein n=1 Tax=Serratia sp. FGI94 TaxID=671990 RepID=UPI000F511D63|nr:hypothetical protein [Serratia sp. FGI94]
MTTGTWFSSPAELNRFSFIEKKERYLSRSNRPDNAETFQSLCEAQLLKASFAAFDMIDF